MDWGNGHRDKYTYSSQPSELINPSSGEWLMGTQATLTWILLPAKFYWVTFFVLYIGLGSVQTNKMVATVGKHRTKREEVTLFSTSKMAPNMAVIAITGVSIQFHWMILIFISSLEFNTGSQHIYLQIALTSTTPLPPPPWWSLYGDMLLPN